MPIIDFGADEPSLDDRLFTRNADDILNVDVEILMTENDLRSIDNPFDQRDGLRSGNPFVESDLGGGDPEPLPLDPPDGGLPPMPPDPEPLDIGGF